jgi:nitrogen fixation protein FixH
VKSIFYRTDRSEQTDPSDQKPKRKQPMPEAVKDSGTRWKLGIVLLIGVFLVGMVASLVTAARRVSRVVDTDYYSHGLHYGQAQDGSRNAGLAWTITPGIAGSELQAQVRDASGAPVAGGKLSFVPQVKGVAQPAGTLELLETAPGDFRARRPGAIQGELHGTLRFTRGGAVVSRKLVLFN